jgi:hypothetical protein
MEQEWIEKLAFENPTLPKSQIIQSLKKKFIDGVLCTYENSIQEQDIVALKQVLELKWELFKRCIKRGKPLFEFMNALGLGTACTFYCLSYY